MLPIEPSWLQYARQEVGTKEVPGEGDNLDILQYAKDAGIDGIVNHDAVPWCAAFVGSMLKRASQQGSRLATAVSYRTWGKHLSAPILGAIVHLSPAPSVKGTGHVGFLIGVNKTTRRVRLLGGNQGDAVSIADFPLDRVMAYRWPTGVFITPEWVGPTFGDASAQAPSDR